MYPIFRLVTSLAKAKYSKHTDFNFPAETSFRCMPWDLDIFFEMNNGRVLTLYDLGRFDLSVKTGFATVLKNNKWGLVVAGSTVRYRKRIRVFDKVTMFTQVAGIDEKWIYIEQSMWVKGQAASSVLLRTGVTEKGKVVLTKKVFSEMHLQDWNPPHSNWLESWIASEEIRPWPPSTQNN